MSRRVDPFLGCKMNDIEEKSWETKRKSMAMEWVVQDQQIHEMYQEHMESLE